MSKKISDKELNNVSGGNCLNNEYYTKMTGYDSNGKEVESLTTYKTSNFDDAKQVRKEKFTYLFNTYSNIVSISWITMNRESKTESGTEHR